MGYVTAEYYKSTYHGNSIPDVYLMDRLDKASMDVDLLTRMKIKKLGGFDKLSEYEKNQVMMAVCCQADHIHTKASMDGVSSYSIGDVSVSVIDGSTCDKRCVSYLSMTRLINRGL